MKSIVRHCEAVTSIRKAKLIVHGVRHHEAVTSISKAKLIVHGWHYWRELWWQGRLNNPRRRHRRQLVIMSALGRLSTLQLDLLFVLARNLTLLPSLLDPLFLEHLVRFFVNLALQSLVIWRGASLLCSSTLLLLLRFKHSRYAMEEL